MTLKDMLQTARLINGTVEVRDEYNYEIGTFPIASKALEPYEGCEIGQWFPGGAPFKDCSFTVILKAKGGEQE